MNKRLVLAASLALVAAFFLGGAWAHARQGAQTQAAQKQGVPGDLPSAENRGDVRQKTFEIVWRTVKEKHFDPAMGGVDWDKARETYASKVAAVKSDRELYPLLQEMLGLLRQSHFNIIPPESLTPEDQNEPSSGGVGIDLRMVGGAAMITRIDLEFPPHALDDDLEVQLAHAADDRLGGLGIGVHAERRIFLGQLRQRDAQLVLVRLGLRLDGDGDDGVREAHRLENDRVRLVAQRIAGARVLQPDRGGDVAGAHL